jgi:hypothetical protein
MRAEGLPVYEEAMRKYTIPLTITITATACHGLNGRYRNMEKWRVIDREGSSLPLRGMPVKVTEYSYPASDSLTPEKWKGRRRLPDGRIKTIETQAAERPTATISSYSTDGDEVMARISSPDGNFEVDNFYRRAYEPDSTLTFAGAGLLKKLVGRIIYHSDYLDNPIIVMSISRATRSVTQYSYRYDKSGNWVRRIATTLNNKVANDPKTLSTITDREIVY